MLIDQVTFTEKTKFNNVINSNVGKRGHIAINSFLEWNCPTSINIKSIIVYLAQPAQGDSIQFLLKKNGSMVTEEFLEIPDGEKSVIIDGADLIENFGVDGDRFRIEILQVGSTFAGAGIGIQVNYLPSSEAQESTLPDENTEDLVLIINEAVDTVVDADYYMEMPITKDVAAFANSNGTNYTMVGFAENRVDFSNAANQSPAPSSFGQLTNNEFINGLRVKTIIARRNDNLGIYSLWFSILGAYAGKDFITSIYIKSLGTFPMQLATYYSSDLNENLSTWSCNLSMSQFNKFVAEQNDYIRIHKEEQFDRALEGNMVVCCYPDFVFSSRRYGGFRNFGVSRNVHDTPRYNMGLLLNNSVGSKKLAAMQFYSVLPTTTTAFASATSTRLQFYLIGPNISKSYFGALKIQNFLTLPSSAASYGNTSVNKETYWQWYIENFSPARYPKKLSDIPRYATVEVDTTAFAQTHSITGAYYSGNGTYGTYYRKGAYKYSSATWGTLGTITVKGMTVIEILFYNYPGHSRKYYLQFRINGYNANALSLKHFEIKGVGRFYFDEASINYTASTTVNNVTFNTTTCIWDMSKWQYDTIPSSGAISIQLV